MTKALRVNGNCSFHDLANLKVEVYRTQGTY